MKQSKILSRTKMLNRYNSSLCFTADGLKVLFFGTDVFSVATINALHKIKMKSNKISDLSIVCGQDSNIKGNKITIPPVVKYAQHNKLPYTPWSIYKSSMKSDKQYDIAVVSSFGHLIPQNILAQFPKGSINIHPSILPRWRGAAPIIHTILAGDKSSGISVIDISPNKFDEGKILLQRTMKIPNDCTSGKLLKLLSMLAANMVPEVIDNIDMLRTNAICQDITQVTYAPKVSKQFGVIDFETNTCGYVERLQRAVPNIGLRSFWQGKQIKFGNIIRQEPYVITGAIGDCQYHKDEKLLSVQLKDSLLFFKSIQVGSRKMISASSFYNGFMVDKKRKGVLFHIKFES